MKYLLIAIYLAFTTGGLFCFKSGGEFVIGFKNGINFSMPYMTFVGFILYLCSFLLWQKLVATYDLSYIVPITMGIIQVITLIFSYFFFHETINIYNLVGIALVVGGVILISIRK